MFYLVLGIELRASCRLGKHGNNQATSLTNLSIYVVFAYLLLFLRQGLAM